MWREKYAGQVLIICTAITLSVAIAAGCRSAAPPKPDVREYRLKGRVESIDLAKKRAIINHEDIDGYMKAMTMGFQIPDEQVLKSLKSGDHIEARLVFDSRTNLSWLENIKRTETVPEASTSGETRD